MDTVEVTTKRVAFDPRDPEQLRYTRFGIRRKLLRRIQRGGVCGHIKLNGQPCLASPRFAGRCAAHRSVPTSSAVSSESIAVNDVGRNITTTCNNAGLTATLLTIIREYVSDDEALQVEQLLKATPVETIEEQITLCKLRLLGLVKNWESGFLTLDKING